MWGLWGDGRGSRLLWWGGLRNERDGNSLPRNLQPKNVRRDLGNGGYGCEGGDFLVGGRVITCCSCRTFTWRTIHTPKCLTLFSPTFLEGIRTQVYFKG